MDPLCAYGGKKRARGKAHKHRYPSSRPRKMTARVRRELDFGRVSVSQIRTAGLRPSARVRRQGDGVRLRLPRENENEKRSGPAPMPASSVDMSLRSPPGCVSIECGSHASTTKPSTTHQSSSFERCCSISSGRMQRCASAALLLWFSDSSAWSLSSRRLAWRRPSALFHAQQRQRPGTASSGCARWTTRAGLRLFRRAKPCSKFRHETQLAACKTLESGF